MAKTTGLSIVFIFSVSSLTWANYPIRTVVLRGDPVPGIPESAVFTTFDPYSINNDGTIAMSASISGAGITSANNEGVWAGTEDSFSLIARKGWTAPDSMGRVYSQFLAPLIADNGQVSFTGIYPGGFEAGVFSSYLGSTRVIARDGMQAPGMPQGVLFRAPLSNSESVVSDPAVNSLGQTAFYSFMGGGSVRYSVGLWSEASGSLGLVAREGGAAPGTTAGVVFSSFGSGSWSTGFWPVINDHGRTAFRGTLSGPGVTFQNELGVWSEASGALSLVARAGDSAPGTPAGVQFGTYLSDPNINNQGQVAFQASLIGPGVTAANDSSNWLANATGALNLLVREGSPAPQTEPGVNLGSIFSETPILGGSGGILFSSLLSGPSIDADNNTASWMIRNGQIELVAREGDQAPGLPDGVVFGDSPFTSAINVREESIVSAYLIGPGGSAYGSSLWGRDSSGILDLIVRTGDLIEVRPGDYKTVAWTGSLGDSSGENGHLQVLNDAGQFLFQLGFTDNTRGVFIATIPEPSSIVFLLLGAFLLRRR